jgi:hypothetical protein
MHQHPAKPSVRDTAVVADEPASSALQPEVIASLYSTAPPPTYHKLVISEHQQFISTNVTLYAMTV